MSTSMSGAQAPAEEEDDDGNVSITSTVDDPHDDEFEFAVEHVLLERASSNGGLEYLVEWTGFPLHQCTWEPESNLGDELRKMWDDRKLAVQSGEMEQFDLRDFENAVDDAQLAKDERHRKRNAKRRRLGLPMTAPFYGNWSDGESDNSYDDGADDQSEMSDEAFEEDTVQDDWLVPLSLRRPAVPRQKMFGSKADSGGAKRAPTKKNSAGRRKTGDLPTPTPRPPTKGKAVVKPAAQRAPPATRAPPAPPRAPPAPPTPTKPRPELPSATRQGTGRKTSLASPSDAGPAAVSESLPVEPRVRAAAAVPESLPVEPRVRAAAVPERLPVEPRVRAAAVPESLPVEPRVRPAGLISRKSCVGLTARAPGAIVSARRTGATTLTARRTGQNAFVDGTRRKERARLESTMSDGTKKQRHFKHPRHVNMAEKKAREKADRAPDPSVIAGQLFPITAGPELAKGPAKGNLEALPPPVSNTAAPLTVDTNAVVSADPTDGPAYVDNRPKKKRKSVRFGAGDEVRLFTDDADRLVEEPMEIGNEEPIREPAEQPTPEQSTLEQPTLEQSALEQPILEQTTTGQEAREQLPKPPGSRKKLSLAAYQSRNLTQVVAKKVIFGPAHGSQVHVLFSGIPRDASQPWMAAFLAQDVLHFGHVCFGESAMKQLPFLKNETLSSGAVTSPSEEPALDLAAERLKAIRSGLYLSHPAFNILVYPTGCDEWQASQLGIDPPAPSAVFLSHVIFSPSFNCGPLLNRLLSPADMPLPPLAEPRAGSLRENLMHHFLGLDPRVYDTLLPRKSQEMGAGQSFFLAFPPSHMASLRQLGLWLQSRSLTCMLYASSITGDWAAFCKNTVEKGEPGVIIVHESALLTVRRFPGLLGFLRKPDDYSIWCLSQSTSSTHVFESPNLEDDLPQPGRLVLAPLFPEGTAILVTPSFLVSEPRQAFELFAWFGSRPGKERIKLVMAWNICDYLRELVFEKFQQLKDVTKPPNYRRGPADPEPAAPPKAVVHDDFSFRYAVWRELDEVTRVREAAQPWSAYDEDNWLVYADRSIDPNDEQSLVNWFGWWSMLRFDQFRNFHVVGSSRFGRAIRTIETPQYTPGTHSDPDVTLRELNESLRQESTIEASSTLPVRLMAKGSNGLTQQTPNPQPSRLFDENRPHILDNYLMEMNGKPKVWRVYGYAVYWRDADEAFNCGVLSTFHKTIKEWWNYLIPFSPPYSVYIALFHTVVDGWSKDEAHAGEKPQREPWLGCYRPSTFQAHPCTDMDLIIWDPIARERFPAGTAIEERDLPQGQQAVIRCVSDNTSSKNVGSNLARVWLGGPTRAMKSENDLDTTAEYLKSLVWGLKTQLPHKAEALMDLGYRRVRLLGDTGPDFIEGNSGMAVRPADVQLRSIFHPPRVRRPPPQAPTKCRNHLYEEARLVRQGSWKKDFMTYEFPRTTDWYADQKAEGSGYEHINVDTWQAVFNSLGVGSVTDGAS